MSVVRPLLTLASPGGRRGRLSILVLHRVLAAPDPVFPEALDVPRFTALCRWVGSMFRVLPLDEAARRLREGTLPDRALAITFDDGYADNRHVAMPVLQAMGMPATVFVSTGFIDGGIMWNDIVVEAFRRTKLARVDLRDLAPEAGAGPFELAEPLQRRSALEAVILAVKYRDIEARLAAVREVAERLGVAVPDDLMMTSADVVALRDGGLQVGAHTVSHPILRTLPPAEQRREIADGKRTLEDLLESPVELFAYPNGKPGEDYDERAVALVRELGFSAAVTTVRGAASVHSDPLQLPRFTPWDRTPLRFGLRMLGTLWGGEERAAA